MMTRATDAYVQFPPSPSVTSKASKPTLFSQLPNPLASASLISLILAQWMQPMISLGSHRILELTDMWPICPADSCDTLSTTFQQHYDPSRRYWGGVSPVFMAYVKTFHFQLSLVLLSCIVYVLALGLQTYVTKALLEFLNGQANAFGITNGYWLVGMMTISSLVAVSALNYLFFTASRIGSNMRSLTMSLVYEKALKLSSRARHEYTSGEILTLMSVDTERVFTAMVQGPWLVIGPLAFLVSSLLIGFLFNYLAAFACAFVLILVLVTSIHQGDRIAKLQRKVLDVIDERVRVTSESLQGIRVMKFYAWEDSLAQRVETLRVEEVKLLRRFHFYQVLNTVLLFITPTFLSGATLCVYLLVHPRLTVVQAFTLVAMVNISRAALNQLPLAIGGLSKAKIAYARLDAFLLSDEVETINRSNTIPSPTTSNVLPGRISIRNGVFQWPETSNEVHDDVQKTIHDDNDPPSDPMTHYMAMSSPKTSFKKEQSFQLAHVNLEIPPGALVMIVGPVGSGKSSLLNAILGEMPRLSGQVALAGHVAYVSQDTWIRNASLRENILFEQAYEEETYRQVINACQLGMDLDALPNGDLTEIGERGINLSGGQKARVALARAMYQSTGRDVVLLDDPLSAVDPHVAHALFHQCIEGFVAEKTRVLVLNSHYDLLEHADLILVMQDGMIAAQGTYLDVGKRFPHLRASYSTKYMNETARVSRDKPMAARDTNERAKEDDDKTMKRDALTADSGALVRAEDRVKGKVSAQVYKTYFDETGVNGWTILSILVVVYCMGQAARTVVDWWPGHWARTMARQAALESTFSHTSYGLYYLAFLVLCTVLSFGRAFLLIESCLRSSQTMHHELFQRVLGAPIPTYFDVTPMGQILNRFSNDLDQMDSILPQEYQLLLQNMSLAFGALVVSAFASYWIGVAYLPIFLLFVYIGQYFKHSSRELKRLEGLTRTPVYTLFSETLSGLETIRAFAMQSHFIQTNRHVVDTNANVYLTYWAASRWLATRLDFVSVAVILIVSLYLVATNGSVGSLTSGLSLTYSLMLTSMVQWVMRSIDRTENAMTSVERLLFFREIEQEDTDGNSIVKVMDSMVPSTTSWPVRGSIRFETLCLRYRPDLPLVLKGVNLFVEGGEKVGICGRTGAGKSSLLVALFRICDFESGRVLIDDVDITTIRRRDLRQRLAIIPQDPVLFSGSLRANLDPFEQHSDERLWQVLQQVHLAHVVRQGGTGLDFDVAESGDNLSMGQRQLVCIARALLKDSQVVVLDEATASVDTATDALIQATIQATLEHKTVLIIAHRLNTILHCDKIAVLEAGQVVECDAPSTLLAQPESAFAALAKISMKNELN